MSEDFARTHRNVSFSNNVTATLRQRSGMFTVLCGSTGQYNGNSKSRIENRFDLLQMQDKNGRNNDTNNTDIDSVARWIRPGKLNTVAPLADIADFQETMVDLGAPLVNAVSDAARRYHDDMVFKGFFGNAYAGESGDDVVPFKPANVLAHGGTGLTKAKLIAIRELIRKRNGPFYEEQPIIVLQPEDESALLNINEYVNQDYTGARPLETGEIKPWMGFRFMPVNPDARSLPRSYTNFFTDGGLTRQLPVIFPSGLHRGSWVEFMGKVDQRADKDYSWQYWGAARSAAVRTDEDLSFIIQTR